MRWLLAGLIGFGLFALATQSEGAPSLAQQVAPLRLYQGNPHDGANGKPTPRGLRVVPQHLPNLPNGRAYVRAVQPLFVELGLSPEAATLITAHTALETGSGSHVTNNNIGNVRAFRTTRGLWHRTTSGRPWRSYRTLREGAQGVLSVVRQPNYQEAYRKLLAGDSTWYSALGLAGYLEGAEQGEPPTVEEMRVKQAGYNQVLAAVRRWLR